MCRAFLRIRVRFPPLPGPPPWKIAVILAASGAATASAHADILSWKNAANGTWGSAVLWNPSQVPTIDDHAQIAVSDANNPYTVTLDSNYVVGSLDFSAVHAQLLASFKTLTVAGQTTLSGGVVSLTNSTLQSDGFLSNAATINTNMHSGSGNPVTFIRASAGLSNLGTINLGTTGQFSNRTAVTIIDVGSGSTLSNLGLIEAIPDFGLYGRARYIRADTLNNQATIRNSDATTLLFDRAGQTVVNSGAFDAANGNFQFTGVASFTNAGQGVLAGRSFTFYGNDRATSTFDNDGGIALTTGSLDVRTYDVANQNGAVVVTGGNIVFNNINTLNLNGSTTIGTGRTASISSISEVNIASAASLAGDGAFTFSGVGAVNIESSLNLSGSGPVTLTNSTFGPGPSARSAAALTTGADSTLNNFGTAAGLTWTNAGTATIVNATHSTLNGPGVNDGTINTGQSTSENLGSSITFNDGLNNNGTINLVSRSQFSNRNSTTFLNVNGSTLTNNGLIDSPPDAGPYGRIRYLRADSLVNHGDIANNDTYSMYMDRAGQTITNMGSFTGMTNGFYMTGIGSFENAPTGQLTGRSFTMTGQSTATAIWRNDGLISLDAGSLSVSTYSQVDNTGTADVSGGNIAFSSIATMNHGGSIVPGITRTATLSSITSLNIAPGAVLDGPGKVTLASIANLNIEDALTINQAEALTLAAVTVQGTGAGVAWNNAGDAVIPANTASTIAGNLFNTGSVAIQAFSSTTVNATLTITGDASNSGRLAIETSGAASNRYAIAYLNVNDGATLTNEATGTLEATPHSGNLFSPRLRYIRADAIVNHGLIVNRDPQTLIFDRGGSVILNTGTLLASGGPIDFDNSTITNDTSGVLAGTKTFDFISSVLVNHGTIAPGTPVIGARAATEAAFGTLGIAGGFTQSATGVIEIEVGDGVQDLVALSSGGGVVDGVIRVVFTESASAPAAADVLTLITGSVTGSYTVEVVNLAEGFEFSVDATGGSLRLTAITDGVFVPAPGCGGVVALAIGALVSRRRR